MPDKTARLLQWTLELRPTASRAGIRCFARQRSGARLQGLPRGSMPGFSALHRRTQSRTHISTPQAPQRRREAMFRAHNYAHVKESRLP